MGLWISIITDLLFLPQTLTHYTSIPLHLPLPSSPLLPLPPPSHLFLSPHLSSLTLCIPPPVLTFPFLPTLPSSPLLSSLHQVSSCIKAHHERGQVELGQSGPSSVFSRLGASNSTRKLDFEEFNLGRILEPDYVNYMRFYFINL